MLRDELEDALAGVRQLLGRGATVGSAGNRSRVDLLTQTGDADLEELIEVAGEDRRELHPLEKRIPRIARLVQDPRVELEPGQLAIQVRELGCLPLGDPSWACPDRGRGGRSWIDGGHVERAAPVLRAGRRE